MVINIDEFMEYIKRNNTGKENAASSKALEAIFNMNGREIRKCINFLRCNRYPICSDKSGYYYAATKNELGDTVTRLSSLINEISNARNGLLFSAKSLEENQSVEINIKIIM